MDNKLVVLVVIGAILLAGGGGYYYLTASGTGPSLPSNLMLVDGYFVANGLVHPPSSPEMSLKIMNAYVCNFQECGGQIYSPVGSKIFINLDIYSPTGAYGVLTIYVKKDLEAMPDEVVVKYDIPINLDPSDSKPIHVGDFTPHESTEDTFGLREYFITIYFNGYPLYDPKDPNSRIWIRTYYSQ